MYCTVVILEALLLQRQGLQATVIDRIKATHLHMLHGVYYFKDRGSRSQLHIAKEYVRDDRVLAADLLVVDAELGHGGRLEVFLGISAPCSQISYNFISWTAIPTS